MKRLRRLGAVGVAIAAFAGSASPAYATDDQWATNATMAAQTGHYNGNITLWSWLTGAYCNVRDANRNIYIAAVNTSGQQYGTFVNYGSGGWRTYSGGNILGGACRNNHSVSFRYDAIDRY